MKVEQFARRCRIQVKQTLRAILLGMALLGCASPICHGAVLDLEIIVGNHVLQSDLAGQTIDINIQNIGTTTYNFTLVIVNAQVADGGPEAGMSIDGPVVSLVNVVAGTIFQANNTGNQFSSAFPQLGVGQTTTSSGTVSLAPGPPTKIATITVDTTGFFSGTFDLRLGNTLNGTTQYGGSMGESVVPMITEGSITVVPEPMLSSCAAAFLCLVFSAARVFKSQRRSSKK